MFKSSDCKNRKNAKAPAAFGRTVWGRHQMTDPTWLRLKLPSPFCILMRGHCNFLGFRPVLDNSVKITLKSCCKADWSPFFIRKLHYCMRQIMSSRRGIIWFLTTVLDAERQDQSIAMHHNLFIPCQSSGRELPAIELSPSILPVIDDTQLERLSIISQCMLSWYHWMKPSHTP